MAWLRCEITWAESRAASSWRRGSPELPRPVQPGTLQRVGALADKLAATPGTADDHVPESPDVVSSRVLDPDQSEELRFTAPDAPGEYPFMCTFPGHWQLMRGVLVVEPAK